LALARPLAERGFQVLIQSVRGTFGSEGLFDPMRCEREDGLATLDWVVKQPWFGDSIVLVGASYLGYVQWAVADRVPPEVKAMIPQVTDSSLFLPFGHKHRFSPETPFWWGVLLAQQDRPLAPVRAWFRNRMTRRGLSTLPLNRADVAAVGHRSDYIQDMLAHDSDAPRWAGCDHRHRLSEVTVPVSSIGGWYDIFLAGQLEDFKILQQAGRPARLTIGPWTHVPRDNTMAREAVEFGLALARGHKPPDRAPVRLYVMGEGAWRDFDSWPPAGYELQRFHLQPGGALDKLPPDVSEPDTYRYDPANPTPVLGGARIADSIGRVDNRAVERRSDVLVYTTPPLDHAVEVIGEISAEIWFRSSLPYADVFVRLCDVDARGRSYNVCDGLIRLSGADEMTCATVTLWPTAHSFQRGHRVRIQVSSGAFPLYARNHGTGAPRATATELRAAEQAVYHDAERPSAIILPVRETS
jgi:putative CocE/NonD family hydrolase